MTFICSAMALPSFPELLFECCQYFLRSRHNSAAPPVPAQRYLAAQCQLDILKQLPVRKFDRQNPLQFANVCLYLLCRKWPDCYRTCLLYTSDAADDLLCVDLGGRRIIKKK